MTSSSQPEKTTFDYHAPDSSERNARGAGSRRNDIPSKRFRFDPNTIDIAGWVSLGVREKTATTIRKYISKGGQFRRSEDLGKIYGLSSELVDELMPFVEIRKKDGWSQFPTSASVNSSGARTFENKAVRQPNYPDSQNAYYKYEKRLEGNGDRKHFKINEYPGKRSIPTIDIATADSVAFESLPGIGPKLAARIISFREKLGGFYSVDQVAQIFGLPDSTFQQLRPHLIVSDGKIRKLSVNESTAETLKSHPYIRWNLANVIFSYRKEHGQLKDLDELKRIALITPEVFAQISPYLEL